MLNKIDSFEINEDFFIAFSKRWLKTNEIYLLLINSDKLIKSELIKPTEDLAKIKPEPGAFYLIKENLLTNKKEFFNKNIIISHRNRSKLKFDGIDVLILINKMRRLILI